MEKEKLIIQDFNQFGGRHCQTAALRNILVYHGLQLSEEMLLGLGGGLGFIYWYMKLMPLNQQIYNSLLNLKCHLFYIKNVFFHPTCFAYLDRFILLRSKNTCSDNNIISSAF